MIKYLITDPKYYGNTHDFISAKLKLVAKKHEFHYACLRDRKTEEYESYIEEFILTCKALHVKEILHNYLDLAIKYNVFGIHFSSDNFKLIKTAKDNGLFVVSSTHTLDEAYNAIELGSDLVTLSPIFHSPDKSYTIGLEKLKEIAVKVPDKIIALGGILDVFRVNACKEAGAAGFASIRYFI